MGVDPPPGDADTDRQLAIVMGGFCFGLLPPSEKTTNTSRRLSVDSVGQGADAGKDISAFGVRKEGEHKGGQARGGPRGWSA